MTSKATKINWASNIVKVTLALLLLSLIVDWVMQQANIAAVDLLVIQILPLLVFAPGIWRDSVNSYLWMSLVLLLYATRAVLNIGLEGQLITPSIQLALTLILFFSAMCFVKWQPKANSSGS